MPAGVRSHGKVVRSQLVSGLGLAIRFLIISDVWKSNYSEDSGVYLQGRLTPVVVKGASFIIVSLRLTSSQQELNMTVTYSG